MAFGVSSVSAQRKNVMIASYVGIGVALSLSLLILSGGADRFMTSSAASTSTAPAAAPQPVAQISRVVMPVSDIEPGTPLEIGMFELAEIESGMLPNNAVFNLEDVKSTYAGSYLSARVPLVKNNLVATRSINLLTERIPRGFRAVTISVDTRGSVEGWVLPGARVDVVWTTVDGGERILKVIVENAKVLSTERIAEGGQRNATTGAVAGAPPQTVTLLVSSKDSRKIQYAANAGVLSLSLRGDGDIAGGEVGGTITMNDMMGVKPAASERIDGRVKVKNSDGSYSDFSLIQGQLKPQ